MPGGTKHVCGEEQTASVSQLIEPEDDMYEPFLTSVPWEQGEDRQR